MTGYFEAEPDPSNGLCPTAPSCDNAAERDCPFIGEGGKAEFQRRAYDTLSQDYMHICPRLLDHMADLLWGKA